MCDVSIATWRDLALILKSIRVTNFRSIKDETLYCDDLTALVGANGSGKSSFLHAAELFQSKSPKIDAEDYYNRCTTEDIVVAVTFNDLSVPAKQLFTKYIQNDELTVERVFKWNEGKLIPTFHGSTLQNRDFVNIYTKTATTAKEEYRKLQKCQSYNDLPPWSNHQEIKNILRQWETDNPDKCKRSRDDGQFFGFNEVAQGFLGKFVRFLYIPAVRDAVEDALEGRGSVLTELMDLVIRKRLADKSEIKEFQAEVKEKHAKIMNVSQLKELGSLENEMTGTLQSFVPNTRIDLSWQDLEELEIKLPKAVVSLVEDGYRSTVDRTGHGLQRAFIMTMLQHLSVAQSDGVNDHPEQSQASEFPVLVLIIEEPELYQHPNSQRHLAEMFLSLAKGEISGVSRKMQVIYSTHSPHFVGIDRINQIRLLRKIAGSARKPKVVEISSTSLQAVAGELSRIHDLSNSTAATLRPRLQSIMNPWMNEGFFSDAIVLVEGESDRAAIIGTAKSMGHMLESLGISIIPCHGKTNLDRPAIIFRKFGIPIYVIWDGDKDRKNAKNKEKDADKKINRALLSLMEQTEEDWPSRIANTFACFGTDMQSTMHKEIGRKLFERYVDKCKADFTMERDQAIKNPVVISRIIEMAARDGHPCNTLEMIIKKIIDLTNRNYT